MIVTQVSIRPSDAAGAAGAPTLTPELLAAVAARYSRNNEGLDAILSRIDPINLDKSVDSIFRMLDYGHASIGDMVPVAMFMDGVSIWLAEHVWALCPTAGGQECSTRYINLSRSGLVNPDLLGIQESERESWGKLMDSCFDTYHSAIATWEKLSQDQPALMGIPKALLEDPSDQAQKKVARMRRNYAFDRTRYYLPMAAATNMMLIMPARAWVDLCQNLLSHPIPEAQQLGTKIKDQLAISAPRMIKHARFTENTRQMLDDDFAALVNMAKTSHTFCGAPPDAQPTDPEATLSVMEPQGVARADFVRALSHHPNRYALAGTALKRTAVRFGWSAVSFAEIRDLNRHRTGTKYSPQLPIGFYFALEQLPGNDQGQAARPRILEQAQVGMNTTRTALNHLKNGDPSYVFWAVLGTQFPFEHTTTADKFIYEAELRTGVGAHFRYAKHLRDVLAIWYERYPETKSLIPHKKVIFLSEPDERLKRAAEMTFWFELYLDRAADQFRFGCTLMGINECTVDKEPHNAVDVIDNFNDPTGFVEETIAEFITRVEQCPGEFVQKAQPAPQNRERISFNTRPIPWLFNTTH